MCSEDTKVIVSLGQCIDILQCKAAWTPKAGFVLNHPTRGVLQTNTANGTPIISEELGLELIAEAEKVIEVSVRALPCSR